MFDETSRTDWSFKDSIAAGELGTMLVSAAHDLRAIGRQPAIVAASPNKYDDTGRYPEWLGLQLGNSWWERAEYGIAEGSAVEDGWDHPMAQTLRPLLDRLEAAGWRALVERAFDFKLFSESLVLAIQHDASWFLISASNEGEDAAFVVEPSGSLLYVGTAQRYDQCLGKAYPLILERIDDASWPRLRKAVPCFPLTAPLIERTSEPTMAAHDALISLLRSAIDELQSVPGQVKYLEGAERDPEYPTPRQAWRSLALDDTHETQQGWSVPERFQQAVTAKGDGLVTVLRILERLESAGWRELFSEAVTLLADDESLALLQRDGRTWIIARRTTLFQLTPSGLLVAGACDYLADAWLAGRVSLHLY